MQNVNNGTYCVCIEVYGCTEATTIAAGVPVDDGDSGARQRRRPGTVGVPLHNVRMKVDFKL